MRRDDRANSIVFERTADDVHGLTEGPGRRPLVVPTDVSNPMACHRLVAAAKDQCDRIVALANVAGYAILATMEELTPESWRRTVDTNLGGTVMLTAAVWPIFREQGNGVVVNVSSMASMDPFPGFSMYAASKAAVNMFTTAAGREGDPLGIRVFCIAPGAIETPMLRSLFDTQTIAPERTLPPEDVADAILSRILDPCAFENGATVPMPNP